MKTKRYKNSGIKLSAPVLLFFGVFALMLLLHGELLTFLWQVMWFILLLTGAKFIWHRMKKSCAKKKVDEDEEEDED